MNEKAIARLMELVLSGRPERLSSALLSTLSEEERNAYIGVEEALAAFASGSVQRLAPSAGLRSRILNSFQAKNAREPRRAVLVIDMIRDHLTEGAVAEVPRARDIVPAMATLLDDFRKKKVPIIYLVDEHREEDPDLDEWGQHAIEGSGGNEIWPELAPHTGDSIVKKVTYSSFTQSSLEKTLEALGCETLVLTGCLTEIGLYSTASEALQRGYAVEIPSQTQAGLSPLTEQITLNMISLMPPYGAARQALLARLAA